MTSLRFVQRTTVVKRDLSCEAAFFRALGDPHRLTIIAMLVVSARPVSVRALGLALPINQSSVSHHLTVLRDAGIVTGERRGTWGYYRLEPRMRVRLASALEAVLRERWSPSEDA